MKLNSRVEFLRAQIGRLDSMLGRYDEDDPNRDSLEFKRTEFYEELQQLEGKDESPFGYTSMAFEGPSVQGSLGMDPQVAGELLINAEELIVREAAFLDQGTLSNSGPIKDRKKYTVPVTGVVRGSFGFEFQELDDQAHIFGTIKKQAIANIIDLIDLAANDAEAFEDIYADKDPRVMKSLDVFLSTLKENSLSLKVSNGKDVLALSKDKIKKASDRAHSLDSNVKRCFVLGRFVAALPASKTFEMEVWGDIEGEHVFSQDIIAGKIPQSSESTEGLERVYQNFFNEYVLAELEIKTTLYNDAIRSQKYSIISIGSLYKRHGALSSGQEFTNALSKAMSQAPPKREPDPS